MITQKSKLNIKLYMMERFLQQKDVLAGSEDKTSHLYRKESYVQGNDE